MHETTLDRWTHAHVFLGEQHRENERRVWFVVALTGAMMVTEIVGGSLFGSLALIADGWHMSTHAAALTIAGLAYLLARRQKGNARFAFGAGKFGDLASYTSAVVLAMIALLIGFESIERLLHPVAIAFQEAIPIAGLSLVVNLVSAWLLAGSHDHGHHHEHHHDHGHNDHDHDHAAHGHRDLNLRAAYVHVVADAATSVLAIVGLSLAALLGWRFMDPIVGLVGMVVILSWAYGLVREAGAVLLDAVPGDLSERVRRDMEVEGDRIADQHLWRIGPGHHAAVLTVVTHEPRPPDHYKQRISGLGSLSHVTVEVQICG